MGIYTREATRWMNGTYRNRFEELLVTASKAAMCSQREDGSMPPGHNGPYHDSDTPVRNTSHWIITYVTAWHITGNVKFRTAAEKALKYLLSPEARPDNSAFHCRSTGSKDKTNGLMGQAWTIEALVTAYRSLGSDEALRVAGNVFSLHRYEPREGGWRRAHLDGTPSGFDRTFNHQLWFCAAGALLADVGYTHAEASFQDFVQRLPEHLKLYPSGLIPHLSAAFLNKTIGDRAIGVARSVRNARRAESLRLKSIGYHAFNTYAFSLIEQAAPALKIGQMAIVDRALGYLMSAEYQNHISHSPYGFPYNPPGLEAAFSIAVFFPEDERLVEYWLHRQWDEAYDERRAQLNRGAADATTSAARLYEICRLLVTL